MSQVIGCAVSQFAPNLDRAENLAKLEAHASLAVSRGADVLVAPEYSAAFDPKMGEWMTDYAEPLEGEFVQAVATIARDHGLTIIVGFLERPAESEAATKPFNTVVAVSAEGELLGSYRKVHLYDAFGAGESEWLASGDPAAEPVVVEVGDFRVGLQTCYDLRFPEVSRRLVDAGAEVLAVPAEWVRGPLKEHHWMTLLEARAIENTVYVVAADQPAPVAVGRSAIIDPRGISIAALSSDEGLAVGWLDRKTLVSTRAQNPALNLRRYGGARIIPTIE